MPAVLVADDDADHREMLALALRRCGYDVVAAGNAGDAAAVLRSRGVDAAVLDVRMPGEDGIELCRRLRAAPGTALLPIVLISADCDEQRVAAALAAGADYYLTKPFPRAELCARLDEMLHDGPAAARRAGRIAATAALCGHDTRTPGQLEHTS